MTALFTFLSMCGGGEALDEGGGDSEKSTIELNSVSFVETHLNKNILETDINTIGDIKNIKPIQELIVFLKDEVFNTHFQLDSSSKIALLQNTSYTEEDMNPLFEKAYSQMILILDKFYNFVPEMQKVLEHSRIDPTFKTMFYKDSIYAMAMVAFLNGCCEGMEGDGEEEPFYQNNKLSAASETSHDSHSVIPLVPHVIVCSEFTNTAQTPFNDIKVESVASAVADTIEMSHHSLNDDLALLPAAMLDMTAEEIALLSLIGVKEKKELVSMGDVDITNLFNQNTNLTRINKRQIRHIHCDLKFHIKKAKEKIQYDLDAPKRAEAARLSAEADRYFDTHAKIISLERDSWGHVIGGIIEIVDNVSETGRAPDQSFIRIASSEL